MCDSVTPPLSCRDLSFFVVSECLFISACKPDKFFLLSSFNSGSTLANAASNNRLIIISHFLPLCIKYKLISLFENSMIVTKSKLALLTGQQAKKFTNEVLRQGVMTLFRKPAEKIAD